MSDKDKKEAPSTQQDQRDGAALLKEVHGLVTELRTNHEERLKKVEDRDDEIKAIQETLHEADISGLGKRFDDLQKAQDEIRMRLNAPKPEVDTSERGIEQRKAFLDYLRTGKVDPAAIESRALVEDATGKILVPDDIDETIIRTIPELTYFYGLVNHRPTNRDRVDVKSLTELTVSWGGKLETGGTLTDSTMTPSREYQSVYDCHGLAKIGIDELMDADPDLADIAADSFARAFAEDGDDQVVAGTGSNRPTGFVQGATVTRVPCAANTAIAWSDVLNLYYQVPAKHLKGNGIAWGMHRTTEYQLSILRTDSGAGAGTGPYVWQSAVDVAAPNRIRGYPVYNSDQFDTVNNTDDRDLVLFGNLFSAYRTVDRQGVYVLRLNELYVEEGMVGFFVGRRWGGSVIRADAVRILDSG